MNAQVRFSDLTAQERRALLDDADCDTETDMALPITWRALSAWRMRPELSDRDVVEGLGASVFMDSRAPRARRSSWLDETLHRISVVADAGELRERLSREDGLGAIRSLPGDVKAELVARSATLQRMYRDESTGGDGSVVRGAFACDAVEAYLASVDHAKANVWVMVDDSYNPFTPPPMWAVRVLDRCVVFDSNEGEWEICDHRPGKEDCRISFENTVSPHIGADATLWLVETALTTELSYADADVSGLTARERAVLTTLRDHLETFGASRARVTHTDVIQILKFATNFGSFVKLYEDFRSERGLRAVLPAANASSTFQDVLSAQERDGVDSCLRLLSVGQIAEVFSDASMVLADVMDGERAVTLTTTTDLIELDVTVSRNEVMHSLTVDEVWRELIRAGLVFEG